MKKICIIVAMLAVCAISANAQQNDLKRCFVQVGAGINAACDNFKTAEPLIGITPGFDFAFGVRPVGGLNLRLGYEGFKGKKDYPILGSEYTGKFNWNFLHFDAMWSITEMKNVRKNCKHFIAAPYLTAGYGFTKEKSIDFTGKSFGVGAGLLIGWRINQSLDLLVDARAVRLSDGTVFPFGTGVCGNGSATLNLVYNF